VSAASRMGRPPEGKPPEGTVSLGDASRRTFLKGAGLVGAAGLAAPLLASTSARASTLGIVLGANAPGAWSPPSPTPGWAAEIPGAVGCRSYRDNVLGTAGDVQSLNGFPGEQGSKVVASIKPDPNVLLNSSDPNNPGLVQALYQLILDGATKASTGYFAGTPQLTVWHEAGNLYQCTTSNTKWCQYGISPGQTDAPQRVRSMHVQMQGLCDQVAADNPGLPRVEYGCIIYGVVSQMASDTDSTKNWVPTPDFPLDWYGIDVYYEHDGTDTTSPHADLATYDLVSQYLNGFLSMARNRSGLMWPKINVCECNANASNDGSRPQYFENLAMWLNNNGGRRMLTFFPDPAGPHSVTWEHVANAAAPHTIDALNSIQATYG
jgi:hypothetical protein